MDQPKTDPFTTEEVHFRNGRIRLAGTLALPRGPGPWPAVVLVHGSGPALRDDPAQAASYARLFAEHGIAALTYDKRGCGRSQGDWTQAGFEVLAEDGLAGLRLLARHPAIDGRAIGAFGVSQGGWIAPLMARESAAVAFIVIVSAPAVFAMEQEKQRVLAELAAQGCSHGQSLMIFAEYYALAAGDGHLRTVRELRAIVRRLKRFWWWKYIMGDFYDEPTLVQLLQRVDHPQARRDLTWDAGRVLLGVHCPVLAIYGAKDLIVPVAENLPLLKGYLKAAGNRDVTFKVFPDANHCLWRARTGSWVELARMFKQGRMQPVPGYRELLVRWIRSRTKRRRSRMVKP